MPEEVIRLVTPTSIKRDTKEKLKGCIVWMDRGKYQTALDMYVKDRYDRGTVADIQRLSGGGLALLHDENQQGLTFRAIEKSIKRGAQKIEVAIPAIRGESIASVKATLIAIKSIVRNRFPGRVVVLLAARPDGIWVYDWEKDQYRRDQD